jgi:hypothetical protein
MRNNYPLSCGFFISNYLIIPLALYHQFAILTKSRRNGRIEAEIRKMKVEYKSAVHTDAGHRSVYIIAEAKKLSEKRCEIVRVITIDDEEPCRVMSRTGAKRQQYNGIYYAEQEVGKKKNISSLFKVIEG